MEKGEEKGGRRMRRKTEEEEDWLTNLVCMAARLIFSLYIILKNAISNM